MNGLIRRQPSQPWGTPGKLRTVGGFACDTLELPWADNQRGISCILPDSYLCWPWESPTMHRTVLRLEDKHGRKDCLIHAGNFAGDQVIDADHDGAADALTQVHGCTLVGMGYGLLQRSDGKGQQLGILQSKATLQMLIAHLGPGSHYFTYVWDNGSPL